MAAAEPFDPFSFEEDDANDDQYTYESSLPPESTLFAQTVGTLSRGETASMSYVTDDTSRQQSQQQHPKSLPPKMTVKLSLHEEVSSSAVMEGGDTKNGGASSSQLFVEGKVVVHVQSSDANRNSPFCLQLYGSMASSANIKCNDHCHLLNESPRNTAISRGINKNKHKNSFINCRVEIPKSQVLSEIMSYSMNVKTSNMPILVQTKATLNTQKICRIGVQIRSNLSNKGDLQNFTIVVAVPQTLQGSTVKITKGDNANWDEMKRLVTWKIGHLPHGKSCLVSIEAEISPTIASLLPLSSSLTESSSTKVVEEKIQFPVLVRCTSEKDQISDLKLAAVALKSVPASIGVQLTRSFRLLHRVEHSDV